MGVDHGHTAIIDNVQTEYTQVDVFGRHSNSARAIASMLSDQPEFIFNVDANRAQAFKEMVLGEAKTAAGFDAHVKAEDRVIQNVEGFGR